RKAEGRTSDKLSARLQQRFFEEGVGTAIRCDPVVFRAFVRMMNMLETPEQAFGRPRVLLRTLWVLLRGTRFRQRYALPDPPARADRAALLERCAALLA